MFQPNCRAIFSLIFEMVECTIDNAFNLWDLVLQELVKIIVVCYGGVYSGWDLFLLKYGGEVFLYEVSSVWFLTVYLQNHPINFTLSVSLMLL
jgi:hypothetical protein